MRQIDIWIILSLKWQGTRVKASSLQWKNFNANFLPPHTVKQPSSDQNGGVKATVNNGHHHHHKHSHSHGQSQEVAPVAYMIIFGDALHNFIDGLSIGSAFTQSIMTGVSVSVAVMCEELPHELGKLMVVVLLLVFFSSSCSPFFFFFFFFFFLWGSVAQWLVCRTHDPAVASSIPTTAHVIIALGKQYTFISSLHPSAKWVPGHRQLKCVDY